MADIKKQVEDLAREARIAARGEKTICGCSTCREAVEEVDKIIADLLGRYCETFTLAVAVVMQARLSTIFENSIGPIRVIGLMTHFLEETDELGRSPEALTRLMMDARKANPKDGPV